MRPWKKGRVAWFVNGSRPSMQRELIQTLGIYSWNSQKMWPWHHRNDSFGAETSVKKHSKGQGKNYFPLFGKFIKKNPSCGASICMLGGWNFLSVFHFTAQLSGIRNELFCTPACSQSDYFAPRAFHFFAFIKSKPHARKGLFLCVRAWFHMPTLF
jgi:hypothetical protein